MSKIRMLGAVLIGTLAVAGCADGNFIGGDTLTTSALPAKPAVDPACVQLSSQIDSLRKEGIAEKVEKAAAKKHKMTSAELAKASELNKANADFQAKCSTVPKSETQAAAATPAAPEAKTALAAKAGSVSSETVKTVAKAEAEKTKP